jgi:hypothetical protein
MLTRIILAPSEETRNRLHKFLDAYRRDNDPAFILTRDDPLYAFLLDAACAVRREQRETALERGRACCPGQTPARCGKCRNLPFVPAEVFRESPYPRISKESIHEMGEQLRRMLGDINALHAALARVADVADETKGDAK